MIFRVCVFILACLPAFAQDRPIGKGINFHSKAKEAALGAQLAEEVRKSNKLLGSTAAREYVERIASALAAQLPADARDCRFEVLAGSGSPMREPWVLPGGHIFVPAGLFLAAESEAEFAGMLAHSMAHSAARHGTRMARRGQIADRSSTPLIYMGGWAGIHGQESTLPLGFLRFLRDFELEADLLAARLMARAGYAPTALARYIERMQVSSTDRPNLYSPLPSREARLTALRQAIAELPAREFPAGSGEFERIQKDVRTIVEGARAAPSQP